MLLLFLDTETTGLPDKRGWDDYYDPSELEHYERSRMIEFACIIYDTEKKEIVKEYSTMIKPDGYLIENSHIHGITHEEASDKGVCIQELFMNLLSCFHEYNIQKIIGHNILFDIHIIRSELFRYNETELLDIFNTIDLSCTMKMGQKRMNQWKSPRLTELYAFLFKSEIEQDHRALSDTKYCFACYLEMI